MITIEPSGEVRFRAYLPHASAVRILGGFTEWGLAPLAMTSVGGGWWEARVAVAPGDWRFRYLADDHVWVTDFAAHGIEVNAFGTLDSCLRIEAAQEPRRRAA